MEVTRAQAEETVRRVAAGLRETGEAEAEDRLLERVAAEGEELRHALVSIGARAVLRDVRG